MTIVGLDLSLTASAAVAVPGDWDADFRRVLTEVFGYSLPKDADEEARARRNQHIAAKVLAFVRSVGAREVWIEGYAYGAKNGREAAGELGGVVRLFLVMAGITVRTVPALTARKLMLGKVPRGSQAQKQAVREALIAAGAPRSWSLDEYDAMCVANFGICETGQGYCFAMEAV